MKLNKKGFTLIELLAVIVILTVIMLIATPTILGVIEDARKGAAKNSAMGYIDALEKEIVAEELRGVPEGSVGLYNTTLTDTTRITVRGDTPSSVSIEISDGKIQEGGTITFGDYEFTIDAKGNVEETGS